MSNTNTTAPAVDPLTIAYIGYGLRTALANGLDYDADHFDGEEGLMHILVEQAAKVDAEWQRRYGVQGIEPNGCDFVFYYEVAEPFGEQYAQMLAKDRLAKPEALIQKLFNLADPDFNEPDPEPAYDVPVITQAIRDHVLNRLTSSPQIAGDFIDQGFAGLARRTETELVEMYEHLFGEDAPRIETASNPDHEQLAA